MISTQSVKNDSARRILIVDDAPDTGKVLGMLLERHSYRVEVVTDGGQCLSCLQSFRPDVVLLDIGMPTISGYDLAKEIRAQPKFDRVALIALSGYADPQHAKLSLEVGCEKHLAKPVGLADMEKAIAEGLESRMQKLAISNR